MKKYLLITGIFLLATLFLWKWQVEKRLTIRIPRDWSFRSQYLGNLVYADKEGKLPNERNLNLYQRDFHVIEWHPDKAVIEDLYTLHDVQTGEITYESKINFTIDPVTARILHQENHPEAKGLYYLFPQNTLKKDYRFFNYNLSPLTLNFDRVEFMDDVKLYCYKFRGNRDWTELYRKSFWGTNAEIRKGQRIIGFNYTLEVWVEPTTGEIVHFAEDAPGDYVVDSKTGKKLAILSKWSGKTTGNTVKFLLHRAQKRLWQLRFYRFWVPGALLAGAFLCLAMVFQLRFRERNNAE